MYFTIQKRLYKDSDAKTQFANDKINKLRFQNHQFLQTLSKPRHADSINRIRWLQWVRRAASATIAPIDNTKMNEKSIMVYVDAIWSRSPKIDASLVSISSPGHCGWKRYLQSCLKSVAVLKLCSL